MLGNMDSSMPYDTVSTFLTSLLLILFGLLTTVLLLNMVIGTSVVVFAYFTDSAHSQDDGRLFYCAFKYGCILALRTDEDHSGTSLYT
jgi:hypothetical protein